VDDSLQSRAACNLETAKFMRKKDTVLMIRKKKRRRNSVAGKLAFFPAFAQLRKARLAFKLAAAAI
jgi:hypothetical protein